MAQIQAPSSDVLGAHLNYGRGCAACHAPHSGIAGNGADTHASTQNNEFLWGQDFTQLEGKSMVFSGGVVVNLPQITDTTPDVRGVLLCLSCHDGNYAQGAMMKNQVYETLPATYGTYNSIPTLMGNEGSLGVGANSYAANHPVGLNAVFPACGGTYAWDCSETNGTVNMNGTYSSMFFQDYGFFVKLGNYNNTPVVMCTTCHNQHSMNAVVVKASNSGQTAGIYATMFFIRAPYNPASTTPGSDQTAQFCRQCHGGESNEMTGHVALPTVF